MRITWFIINVQIIPSSTYSPSDAHGWVARFRSSTLMREINSWWFGTSKSVMKLFRLEFRFGVFHCSEQVYNKSCSLSVNRQRCVFWHQPLWYYCSYPCQVHWWIGHERKRWNRTSLHVIMHLLHYNITKLCGNFYEISNNVL